MNKHHASNNKQVDKTLSQSDPSSNENGYMDYYSQQNKQTYSLKNKAIMPTNLMGGGYTNRTKLMISLRLTGMQFVCLILSK